ncbi:hypothetical protein FBY35_0146 [Streptomyces sp. SLBN-118]|nr:hypothetical protein FBY35_0146 [Streptomyces sp. SLBN-118]
MEALQVVRLEGPRAMEERADEIIHAYYIWAFQLSAGPTRGEGPTEGEELTLEKAERPLTNL